MATWQQLRDCTFNVGGSFSNVATTLNVSITTNSYYQRAVRSTSRTSISSPTSSERRIQLVIQAERLQNRARELSRELKLTIAPPIEEDDLAKTLDEVADVVIPSILRFSIDGFIHRLEEIHEHKALVEIAYMQGILDEFPSKRNVGRNQAVQSLQSTFTGVCLLEWVWRCFWCLILTKYLIITVRKSLIASRDRLYAALFAPLASSFSTPVRRHHIEIIDFHGAQWSLPQDLCLNRQVFFSILRFKFKDGPGELIIALKQFAVFQQYGQPHIRAIEWEDTVKKSDELLLSVLVDQPSENPTDNSQETLCPRCERSDKVITRDGSMRCLRCDSELNIAPFDPEADDGETPSHTDEASSQGQSRHSEFLQLRYSSFRCFSISNRRVSPPSKHTSTTTSFAGPGWLTNPGRLPPNLQQNGKELVKDYGKSETASHWIPIEENWFLDGNSSDGRYRTRIYITCLRCRRDKVKCDRPSLDTDEPCGRCVKRGQRQGTEVACRYLPIRDLDEEQLARQSRLRLQVNFPVDPPNSPAFASRHGGVGAECTLKPSESLGGWVNAPDYAEAGVGSTFELSESFVHCYIPPLPDLFTTTEELEFEPRADV